MKPLLNHIVCYVVIVLFSGSAIAEINYWQVLKKFALESTGKENAQHREYLESLTAEELLIAAKQCSMEIEQTIKPEEWDMVGGAYLGFFYQLYPLKTNNLKDISLLLDDLKDNSQSKVWRRCIMDLLGSSRRDMLAIEQKLRASEIMYKIYGDNSEDVLLKPKAARESADLLISVYSANLRSDPNAQQFTKQRKVRTRELVNAIQSGKVKLSQKTIVSNKKVLAEINKSITTQLNLFSNKQVDISLKKSIIVALARYHKYHLAPTQVSQTLANAINNYKNYDKKLWYLLIKTNIEDFKNQNARIKLQEMINDTKDEDVKKRLIRLNKKLKKSD